MTRTRGIWNIGGSALGLVVILAIAVAFNMILGNIRLRKDLTEEKIYTLSRGTRQILEQIGEPVTLKFFFSESSPEVPVNLKAYARGVQDLLREYEMAADGRIILETYDPKPDSDAEEWAQRYGVAGQPMGFMGPTLFIGLVAVQGENEAVLPALDPRAEDLLEYNITRMITRVADPEKPVLGVISSLPVLGGARPPFAAPGQPEPAEKWFAFKDLEQDYDVRKIEPPVEEIAGDVDALALVHPKNLDEQTLFAIDQFVLRGGALVLFMDPLCLAETELQPNPQMRFSQKESDLPKLLDAWGVKIEKGKVVADLEAVTRVRVGDGAQVDESPVWLSLRGSHLNDEDVLTAKLEAVMMPYAAAISVDAGEEVEVSSLISSSETSGLVDAMTAQFSMDGVRRNFKSGMTRLDLGVRLYGTFKTAFPDGKPEPDEGDAEGADAGGSDDSGSEDVDDREAFLSESAAKSTVIIFGDADMLYDRFCVRPLNFFGFQAHQPVNDNLVLFANAVEQSAGGAALAGIRTRGKTDRPFDVVLDLQRQAQEKYMAEEVRLQQRLEEAQRRLNELQGQKDESQRYILSPQQQKEIKNFQDQVTKTRKELKLVRRRLREDIEKLGVRIKLINILLMPALVSLGGVTFGLYRRFRSKS